MAEAFDTHKAYRELTESDCFPTDQAERLVTLINGAIVGNVATKTDIENLEKTLRLELESQDERFGNKIKTLKSDLKLWIVSAIGLGIGLPKALDYLLPAI